MQQQRKHDNRSPELRNSFFAAVGRVFRPEKLGDMLVASGLVSREQIASALLEQEHTRDPLGKILIRQGSVSAVQLYRKLGEQWCLRASAAGIAVMVQVSAPAPAYAGTVTPSSEFTLVATQTKSPKSGKHPRLFGTREVRSEDISAFKKWTAVMTRFEDAMKTTKGSTPRMMMWKADITRLKGKPQHEQIEAVNAMMNQIRYIEDINNYGVSDYWATPIEFMTRGGDCEDFAIAKYASLRALGFSTEQLRIAIVQDEVKNIPHAVLIVYGDEDTYVLDNQNKQLASVSQVTRYTPFYSLNSTSWWLHKA